MTQTETKNRRRALLPLLTALAVGGAGALWLAAPGSQVSTDDAYLRADDTSIAPQVKGRVLEVLVRDHQRVVTGTPLVRLDPDDLAARTRAAAADLQGARANVQAAQAALTSLDAEEQLAAAQITTVRAGIVAARARERAPPPSRRATKSWRNRAPWPSANWNCRAPARWTPRRTPTAAPPNWRWRSVSWS